MNYFTFGYTEVIEFEGWYDPLYGTVDPVEKGSHRLPRQMFVLGRDAWKTYDDALSQLKSVCESQIETAIQRRHDIVEYDVRHRETLERNERV